MARSPSERAGSEPPWAQAPAPPRAHCPARACGGAGARGSQKLVAPGSPPDPALRLGFIERSFDVYSGASGLLQGPYPGRRRDMPSVELRSVRTTALDPKDAAEKLSGQLG